MTNRAATRTGLAFPLLCRVQDLPEPVAEYAFHPERKWRFDFCWVEARVALECNGGVWTAGRHVRARGYLGDLAKLNEAQLCGWLVLQVVPEALTSAVTFDLVRRALARRVATA
ncbi:MAG TPA: hypothetical protein VKE26_26170 [Xanthobacteraceae bacterium]|nr:hypothetical protein [Xanthobacteraceae bacterium]